MQKPSHDSARYAFRTNSDETGQAWITLEPASKNLAAIGDGTLFLKLRPGVDHAKAQALAQLLDELVEEIEHVRFSGPAR